mmetsp:Transcript_19964/g.40441  ORF Transcript_19964/g.40441 Transcript_19964/m.40441 type:complete len:237 (-) Transcript_19964:616-1326(-)
MRYDFPILSYWRNSDKGMVPSCPTSTPSIDNRTSSICTPKESSESELFIPSLGPFIICGNGDQMPDTLTPPPCSSIKPNLFRSALLSSVCTWQPIPATPGTILGGPSISTSTFLSASRGPANAFKALRSIALASRPSSHMLKNSVNTSTGIMYPMFEPPFKWLEATPTTRPRSSKTGPPELPGLIAASICMRNTPWELTSTRETTPLVTDICWPPLGKPTQVTFSSRRGRTRHKDR